MVKKHSKEWYKSRRISNCRIHKGLCLKHGFSVSKNVRCPKSRLSKKTWQTRYSRKRKR